jgi:hypothetical protein
MLYSPKKTARSISTLPLNIYLCYEHIYLAYWHFTHHYFYNFALADQNNPRSES